jgi:outer membrane murein-binding lipoprotein Lpp
MRRRSAIVMTFAAMTAVGCGSTSAPSMSVHAGTATGTPTSGAATAHFIAAADEICQALHSQQEPLNARVQALTQDTAAARIQLQALLTRSVVYVHEADAKLQALPRPPGEATAIGKLLAGYDQEAAEVKSFASSLTKLEPERQRFASGSLERTTESDRKLAEGLGMKVCAASE